MSPPRKAIIAVTSASAPLFGGKETTGLFIVEALHPYRVLRAAGFEVDLSSETGKYTPDWLSLTPDFLKGEDKETWEDPTSDFRKALDGMAKAEELVAKADEYGVFFASAGHAALIDYPAASHLQAIAEKVWANGGVVASVCHGPAIFTSVKDLGTGEPLVKGHTVTGFTTEAENTMKVMGELRSWGAEMVQEVVERLGGTCECVPTPVETARVDNPGNCGECSRNNASQVDRDDDGRAKSPDDDDGDVYSDNGEAMFSSLLGSSLVVACQTWLLTGLLDKRAPGIWDDYHIVDGRLVTGQNPGSSLSTAKAVVEAFDKL